MMKKNLLICFLVLTSLFLSFCITPIEYETSGESYIVISGVVTNSQAERAIHITRNTGFTGEGAVIPSSGFVYEDGQVVGEMTKSETGSLLMPEELIVKQGKEYFVEIQTDGGSTYRSYPQTIQPRLTTDSLTFDFDSIQNGITRRGVPKYDYYIVIFAHETIPFNENAPSFYRWTIDQSWEFVEILDPGDPTDVIQKCYIPIPVEEGSSTILSGEDFDPGTAVKVPVGGHILDQSFIFRHMFNVYAHSIDREAYEFYEKAEKLTLGTGSLYDEVPAPIKGNLYNPDNPEELVLGYVEFSLADTVRLLIHDYDLKFQITNDCDNNPPCKVVPLPPGTPPPPCKCHECDSIWGPETLIQPEYWP